MSVTRLSRRSCCDLEVPVVLKPVRHCLLKEVLNAPELSISVHALGDAFVVDFERPQECEREEPLDCCRYAHGYSPFRVYVDHLRVAMGDCIPAVLNPSAP